MSFAYTITLKRVLNFRAGLLGKTVWLVLLLLISTNQADSDVFNEIGLLFVFYRDFFGKGSYAELELGFNLKYFVIDLLIVLLASLGITKILTSAKRRV